MKQEDISIFFFTHFFTHVFNDVIYWLEKESHMPSAKIQNTEFQ